MSGAKHTPGPWEAVGTVVRTSRTVGGFEIANCLSNPHDSRTADSHLIAAAPVLLDRLEVLALAAECAASAIENVDGGAHAKILRDHVAAARAVIAKAEGRS